MEYYLNNYVKVIKKKHKMFNSIGKIVCKTLTDRKIPTLIYMLEFEEGNYRPLYGKDLAPVLMLVNKN